MYEFAKKNHNGGVYIMNRSIIEQLPKAELHVHAEGTIEPSVLRQLAVRNNHPYKKLSNDELHKLYLFRDLPSFIHAYDSITQVLMTEQDFYDVVWTYIMRVKDKGVLHVEISFEAQTYYMRDIEPSTIVSGMSRALQQAYKQFGISGKLIFCIMRHLTIESAYEVFEKIIPYKHAIVAIGLAGIEEGYPPHLFADIFARARMIGFKLVAHVEIGNRAYMKEALDILHVDRIDHGTESIHMKEVMRLIKDRSIGMTVCPLSNILLGIHTKDDHPLKALLDAGLIVSIHSDDPAFFGGYIDDNYRFAYKELKLSLNDLVQSARNSFIGSFASDDRKDYCLHKVEEFVKTNIDQSEN